MKKEEAAMLCSGCGTSCGVSEPGKVFPCPACGKQRYWCGPIWAVEPPLVMLAGGMPVWRQ